MKGRDQQNKTDDLITAYYEGLFDDNDFYLEACVDLRTIARSSMKTAIRLADAFCGETLFIPASPSVGVKLVEKMNSGDVQLVIDLLPNTILFVPRFRALRKEAGRVAAQKRKIFNELSASNIATLTSKCVWGE